jgi:hypothetical protein
VRTSNEIEREVRSLAGALPDHDVAARWSRVREAA